MSDNYENKLRRLAILEELEECEDVSEEIITFFTAVKKGIRELFERMQKLDDELSKSEKNE